MTVQRLSFGVIIATYQRTDALANCLDGLARQRCGPDDVIVMVRDTDRSSRDFLDRRPAGGLPLRVIVVTAPGVVAARNAGLDACKTDVIAFLDDDTVPHPDWTERVVAHFEHDPRLGGLGGKDRLHDGTKFDDRMSDTVGQIRWYGRVIPNQHLGHGAPREVDMVKGANMSFRRSAIGSARFDTRLKGQGAQPYEDVAFGLAVRRAGWKLLYDPEVLVDHFSGKRTETRHYALVAALTDRRGFEDLAYNEVVALWDDMPAARRAGFMAWSLLIGTGVCPGLVQAVRFTPRLGLASWQRFLIAQQSKLQAWMDLRAEAAASKASR